MANVLLTDFCNRGCAYCFARKKISTDTDGTDRIDGTISMENVDTAIKFLKRSGVGTFTALGGEPTLHPCFTEILDRAYAEDLNVRVFSNGLIPPEHLSYLERTDPRRTSIIININEPDEYRDEQWAQTIGTLESLGGKVSLGFNIYNKRFDSSFLVDLTIRHGLRRVLRIGLAQPIYGADNAYIPVKEYSDISGKIVALAKRCSEYDIALDFDCGFTLCMFSEQQLGELYFNGTPFVFTCPTVIDIGTNLDVWHCFPLSTIMNTHLSRFENRNQIARFYFEKLHPYRRLGSMDRCASCKHLRRGFCSGGCLSHNLSLFCHSAESD